MGWKMARREGAAESGRMDLREEKKKFEFAEPSSNKSLRC
jgi:hypothetical protein